MRLGVEGGQKGGVVRPISPRALWLGMGMAPRSPWPRGARHCHLSTWKLGTQAAPAIPRLAMDQRDPERPGGGLKGRTGGKGLQPAAEWTTPGLIR